MDVNWSTYRKAPPPYALIRYRVGSAAILKARVVLDLVVRDSDCSEIQRRFSEQRLPAVNQPRGFRSRIALARACASRSPWTELLARNAVTTPYRIVRYGDKVAVVSL